MATSSSRSARFTVSASTASGAARGKRLEQRNRHKLRTEDERFAKFMADMCAETARDSSTDFDGPDDFDWAGGFDYNNWLEQNYEVLQLEVRDLQRQVDKLTFSLERAREDFAELQASKKQVELGYQEREETLRDELVEARAQLAAMKRFVMNNANTEPGNSIMEEFEATLHAFVAKHQQKRAQPSFIELL